MPSFPFTGMAAKWIKMAEKQYETGTVKWFDAYEGFGFIISDKGGEIYVHYSAILCGKSECELEEGNRVQFSIFKGPKGKQAQDVVVLEG